MSQKINKNLKTAFLMLLLSAGCKLIGFARQILLANYFGTGEIVDSYVMAQSIPNILFGGVLVAFSGSYMPLLSKRYEKEGIRTANKYTSHVLITLFLLSICITILGIVFSDEIVNLMAPGLNMKAKKLTMKYVKYTFGYTYFAASAGIYTNYLQYKGIFVKQIVGDYIQNALFIFSIIYSSFFGDVYLITGLFLGYLFRVLYLRLLTHNNGFKLVIDFKDFSDNVKEVSKYAIPIFLSTTTNEINAFVDRSLASQMDSGSISALNYAHLLSTTFIELSATILTTMVFPKLVQSFSRGELNKYREFVQRGSILCLMVSIPLSLGCISFSKEIVSIVFQRGAFIAESTERTANSFVFYSFGIIFLVICNYLSKVFYSIGDMKTPMFCAGVSVIINIVGNYILVNYLQEQGLALATSVASIVNAFLLVILFCKKNNGLLDKKGVGEIVKIIISSIVMITLGILLKNVLVLFFDLRSSIIFIIIVLICTGIYAIMLYIFKVEELLRYIRKRK